MKCPKPPPPLAPQPPKPQMYTKHVVYIDVGRDMTINQGLEDLLNQLNQDPNINYDKAMAKVKKEMLDTPAEVYDDDGISIPFIFTPEDKIVKNTKYKEEVAAYPRKIEHYNKEKEKYVKMMADWEKAKEEYETSEEQTKIEQAINLLKKHGLL